SSCSGIVCVPLEQSSGIGSGRSVARLARLLGVQEVASSNLAAPTIFIGEIPWRYGFLQNSYENFPKKEYAVARGFPLHFHLVKGSAPPRRSPESENANRKQP